MSVHEPVLLDEVMQLLEIDEGDRCVDATMGGGGHTRALLERVGTSGRVVALDRDREALERNAPKFASFDEVLTLIHANYDEIEAVVEDTGLGSVDAVLMDLGVSSDQLDTGSRGFSFMKDAPLDMRMDRSSGVSASEWISGADVSEMALVFSRLGEEPRAKRIARAIVEAREEGVIETTLDLVRVVEQVTGPKKGRIHPATRVFQAIRMKVNEELTHLEVGLEAAMRVLAPGGRLAVISFHSLEDRLVKHCMKEHVGREVSLMEGGSRWEGRLPRMKAVTRKPMMATESERACNPRSRSAKLRVCERIM